MSFKIKDLKEEHPAIYELAMERRYKHADENYHIGTAFSWIETPEGARFWSDIDNGKFQPFYDRYPEHAKPIKYSELMQCTCSSGGEAENCDKKCDQGDNEEPKGGDMVEACEYTHENWENEWTYTGGKTTDGRFICESNHGLLVTWKHIRLPQKSEVESKAKSIIEEYKEAHGFRCPNTTRPHYDSESVELMIIEAIKWGQQNPSAK